MIRQFFSFEVGTALRKPLVYLLTTVIFTLFFLSAVSENLTIGMKQDGMYANGPFTIAIATTVVSLMFGLFIALAMGNGAALRDVKSNFQNILYSYPLPKFGYYWGRFMAAWLLTLIPLAGGLLGLGLGYLMPFAATPDIGPTQPMAYVQAFVLFILPNSFILVALTYSLAMRYRSATAGFVGTILMLLLYVVGGNLMLQMDTGDWVIYLDPLGFNATVHITRYWTVFERNSQLLFTDSLMLINRLLWLGLSLGLLLWQYRKFSFVAGKSGKTKKATPAEAPEIRLPLAKPLAIPAVAFRANARTRFAQFMSMLKMDLGGILRGTTFWILATLGLLNGLNTLMQADGWFNNGSYPVTYIMIEALHSGFQLFLYAIIIYYAGVLIWREREDNLDGITDAMPYTNTGRISSKIVALMLVVFILQTLSIGLGILTQLSKGWSDINLAQYAIEILGIDFLGFAWLIILTTLLHSLIQHKYMGYGATLAILLLVQFGLPRMGVESLLWHFGSLPGYTYSEFNGLGPFAGGIQSFALYWSALAVALWALAARFWVRGHIQALAHRIRKAWQGHRWQAQATLLGALLVFLVSGGFLFYNTQVVNTLRTKKEQEQRQADYEKQYRHYARLPQPKVVAAEYAVDLYPHQRQLSATAQLTTVNATEQAITELHLTDPLVITAEVTVPGTLTHHDEALGYRIYTLDQPLAPGDTLMLTVNSNYAAEGIEQSVKLTELVPNGTFLNNQDLLPTLGYVRQRELMQPADRKKYDLPERKPAPHAEDATAEDLKHNYVTQEADWIQLGVTVSTVADQVAIAPGNLVKEWTENGRRYYRYESPKPVLNFVNFVSANYEVATRTWQKPGHAPVTMEVYHHPNHGYNVEHMLESIGRSLDYYTRAFGPYPHAQARIIEFPRYANFAQAFPGTMPYGEGIGFVTDITDEEEIDQVLFVVAHEMGHQWWAHQVIGADVAGSTVMSETFAQYSALLVMEEAYGRERMKQFLAFERDKYLKGRGKDNQPEAPLMYNQGQSYIHYQKGGVAMYALREYLGEEKVNGALRAYLQEFGYQAQPYNTVLDVLADLREATPDSLQYLVDDLFGHITLYQNQTTEAVATANANGGYTVELHLAAQKLYADGTGMETEVPMNDWVAVGIYPKETKDEPYPAPLYLEYHQLRGDTVLTVSVAELPHRAGIDPNHLLIDRMPDDNLLKVSVEE